MARTLVASAGSRIRRSAQWHDPTMTEAQKQQLRDCIAILSESIETFDGAEAMAETMYADMQDVLDRLANLLAEVS
jgi:hypothetical protein